MENQRNSIVLSLFRKLNIHDNFIYRANPGNGGDALIAAGTIHFLKKHGLNFTLYQEGIDLTDKHVIYGGGGNFVKEYKECSDFIAQWHSKVQTLVVLPHTINGHFELLQSLGSNVHLIARENRTFDYLKNLNLSANIYLDDDMALNYTFKNNFLNVNLAKKIFIKRTLKKLLKFNIDIFKLKAFRKDIEKTAIEIPENNIDISKIFNYNSQMDNEDKILKTANDFVEFISYHRNINSNRLHVCIAAHLLGKKVNFYSNSYYKNEEVYKKSLVQNQKIVFHK